MKTSSSSSIFSLHNLPCSSAKIYPGNTGDIETITKDGTRIKIENRQLHGHYEIIAKKDFARLLIIERNDEFQLRMKIYQNTRINKDKNGNILIYSLETRIELKKNYRDGNNYIEGDSLHAASISGTGTITINVRTIHDSTISCSGSMAINSRYILGSTFIGGSGSTSICAEHDINQSDITGGKGELNVLAWRGIKESNIKIGPGDGNIHAGQGIYRTKITGDEGDVSIYAGFNISESVIQTGSGNDSIYAGNIIENCKINTGEGNDVIYANYLEDSLLDSGNGDDFIVVRAAGSAVIQGGVGNDILWVGASDNTVIHGGDGDDIIYSNRESDADEAEVWVDTVDPKIRAEIERRNAIVRAGASAPEGSRARAAFNQLGSQQSQDEYDHMCEKLQGAHSGYHKMLQSLLLERISQHSFSDLAIEIALDPSRLY